MKQTKRQALMNQAVRYREGAAAGADANSGAVWACGRGHQWDDALDERQNVRCMNCASQRRELEARRLREIARVRGGTLTVEPGPDRATAPVWECAYGHRFVADARHAQRYWCAECARTVFAAIR
jgi:hypothetical protein